MPSTPERGDATLPPSGGRPWIGPESAAAAGALAAATVELLQHVGRGESVVIGERVLVLSATAADADLARMIAAHGAQVEFAGPEREPSAAPAELHAAVYHLAARSDGELDPRPWADTDLLRLRSTADHAVESIGEAERYQRLIAVDVVPTDAAAARDWFEQNAGLVAVGGTIDAVWTVDGTAGRIDLDALSHELPMVGVMPRAPTAEAEGTWVRAHQTFVRLSEPCLEYPDETNPSYALTTALAHTLARLQCATGFVDGAKVLEAGCGTGMGARMFRAAGAAHVTAIDVAGDALTKAAARTDDGDIDYQQWDLERTPLPFDDAAFDVVVCLEVIEHLHGQEALLAEFHRVLRPGGLLVSSVPDREFEQSWTALLDTANAYHVRTPSREEFLELLAAFEPPELLRQVDLTGSIVLPEGGSTVEGEFEALAGRDLLGHHTVLLATCRKPGGTGTHPHGPTPRLYLHSNAFAADQEQRTYLRQLETALVRERHARQVVGNRLRALESGGPFRLLELDAFRHQSGSCWVAVLPGELASGDTSESPRASTLRLFEDGAELGPGHCVHDDIGKLGGGRFCHWNDALYFSTTDGSDPADNGRRYVVVARARR